MCSSAALQQTKTTHTHKHVLPNICVATAPFPCVACAFRPCDAVPGSDGSCTPVGDAYRCGCMSLFTWSATQQTCSGECLLLLTSTSCFDAIALVRCPNNICISAASHSVSNVLPDDIRVCWVVLPLCAQQPMHVPGALAPTCLVPQGSATRLAAQHIPAAAQTVSAGIALPAHVKTSMAAAGSHVRRPTSPQGRAQTYRHQPMITSVHALKGLTGVPPTKAVWPLRLVPSGRVQALSMGLVCAW